jgi:antitoxin component of RelBE/YafQ-DinJ toxin-antitoxin module
MERMKNNMENKKRELLPVYLESDVKVGIRKLGKHMGMSMSSIVNMIVKQNISKYFDL